MTFRSTLLLGLCAALVAAAPAMAADAAPAKAAGKTKVLFIAGHPSHPHAEHEHRAGCMLLAKSLMEGMPNVDAKVDWYDWPKDEKDFDGVSTVVMYCDGGEGHYANQHLDFIQGLVDKGVGLVCIHYGVEVPKGPSGDKFLQWIGGYFEPNWSVNPTWDANYTSLPNHPISNGVKPFAIHDEWYYHMRFVDGMKGVTPILTALPPKSTLERKDGPHEGNPAVREAIAKGEVQHMAWAYDRPNGSRGFGFTGAHYHKNWQNDDFRKLVLNAIVWTAKLDVPAEGVKSTTPTDAQMQENLDEKK